MLQGKKPFSTAACTTSAPIVAPSVFFHSRAASQKQFVPGERNHMTLTHDYDSLTNLLVVRVTIDKSLPTSVGDIFWP